MTLDPRFVIQPALQQQLWDKDLNVPLAAGIVYYWEDSNRTNPKQVYELVGSYSGGYQYVSLGTQIVLSSIGTFEDLSGNQIIPYLYPFTGLPTDAVQGTVDNYFIEVYSGANPPVFQFSIQGWPNIVGAANPSNSNSTTENIISNPQFVEVSFNPAATMSVPAIISTTGTGTVTDVAPDWVMITNGNGSFSVFQDSISGTNIPSNPSYALAITSSAGYNSALTLRQRLTDTTRIFANEFVSGTFIASALDGGSHILSMYYVPSSTNIPQLICTGTTTITGFTVISNVTAVQIDPPNSGNAPSAYKDIIITIPLAAAVEISSIQLCGVTQQNEVITYLEETTARQIDHLFHYYQPKINFKPIASLLTGWDFPLNPAQLGSTFTVGNSNPVTTVPQYTWDQTIMASVVGNLNVTRVASNNSLSVVTTNNNEAFYLLQYLSGAEAIKTTLSNLSVNINAYCLINPTVNVRVYLYYSSAGGAIPALGATIGLITYNMTTGYGDFSLTAPNWSLISQFNGQSTNSGIITSDQFQDIQMNNWNGKANFGISTTNNFAIVVTFGVKTSGTQTVINSISLVPGDIPTRPAPQTQDEVLRECQYYLEISDPDSNGVYFQQNSLSAPGTPSADAFASAFELNYQQKKRHIPTFNISSNAGTAANVSAVLNYVNAVGTFTSTAHTDKPLATYWVTASIGTTRAAFIPGGSAATSLLNVNAGTGGGVSASSVYSSAEIFFIYVLNAQLGIV